ncbi:MAG: DUF2238 domain-containing protein [Candidatus Pacebacteria bacterium]|nr:DUF2238 domain-containing protein [Candidatus Paceibacterota bacterium]
MFKKYFPHLLLAIYVIEFIVAGIHPFSRDVWYAENGPIFILVAFMVFLYFKNIRFSNTAYAFMFVLPFLHTIGGHYTFEKVPFDWFGNFFGFERNMFDRVAHFTVGFYALPIMEYLLNRNLVAKKWIASTYAIFTISFVAVLYEWIEWIYAEIWGGDSGAAFLGSQGDIWDAQKDMLMDVSGAVFVVILYFVIKRFGRK